MFPCRSFLQDTYSVLSYIARLVLSYDSKFPGSCSCYFLVLQFPAFLLEVNQNMLKEKLIRYVRFSNFSYKKLISYYCGSFSNMSLMLLLLVFHVNWKIWRAYLCTKNVEKWSISLCGKYGRTKLARQMHYPTMLLGDFWIIRSSSFQMKGVLDLHFCLIFVQQIDI